MTMRMKMMKKKTKKVNQKKHEEKDEERILSLMTLIILCTHLILLNKGNRLGKNGEVI